MENSLPLINEKSKKMRDSHGKIWINKGRKVVMQRGVRELARRPPGNLFRRIVYPEGANASP